MAHVSLFLGHAFKLNVRTLMTVCGSRKVHSGRDGLTYKTWTVSHLVSDTFQDGNQLLVRLITR